MIRKSTFMAIVAAGFTLTSGATALAQQSSGAAKPNVIVILTDDMGWSDIGAFGGEIKTPNIDRLAKNGRQFTQFYNTARCCPTRASLLTGLYPHQAGVGHMLWDTGYPGYTTRLTSDTVTLAEVLRDTGYSTYMAGKWHLSERVPDRNDPTGWPLQRGFDKFYGTLQGYGSFYDPATLVRDNTYITPENDPEYKPESYYYTDAINDNSIRYLKQHHEETPDKPFFLYMAHTAAHWPIHAPEEAIAEYNGAYDEGFEAIREKRFKRQQELGIVDDVPTSSPTTGDWDKIDDKAWEARRMEAFSAMITRMDVGIGKMIAMLEETGQLDNTIIVYLHDNGGCEEEFFQNAKLPDNPKPMDADEVQTRTLPPMQTRDGRPVRSDNKVMAGPDDSFLGYGPGWADVSNTPLRGVKKQIYEGGISTPLIVHWPAGLKDAGKEYITTPGHLIDIMPTIVELAGATYPTQHHGGHQIQPMEGVSLVPLLTGKGEFKRENPIFWEHQGNRGVRSGNWKLVADEYQPWELYDLSKDRAETNNLAEKHPDVVKELAQAWDEYADRAKVRPYGAHRLRGRDPDPVGTPDKLVLDKGDVYKREYSPALSDAGVSITAQIRRSAPNGVIVAQGGRNSGYTLYMKDNHAHFAVRRAGKLLSISSKEPVAAETATKIVARLERNGAATLEVDGQPVVTDNFYGPLLDTPGNPLSAGWDQDSPVGEYPESFPYEGQIGKVYLEILR